MGVCVSNGISALGRCKCDPFFTGDTCRIYACHTFCYNNGICYVVPGPTPENDSTPKVLVKSIFKINTIFSCKFDIKMYMF